MKKISQTRYYFNRSALRSFVREFLPLSPYIIGGLALLTLAIFLQNKIPAILAILLWISGEILPYFGIIKQSPKADQVRENPPENVCWTFWDLVLASCLIVATVGIVVYFIIKIF